MQPDRRIVICDNCTDRAVELARSRPGWEVWETVGNTGKKGGALNQAWDRLTDDLARRRLHRHHGRGHAARPRFIDAPREVPAEAGARAQLGGVCANFPASSSTGPRRAAEDGVRARREDQPLAARHRAGPRRRGDDVLGARHSAQVYRSRGMLYKPVLTEDYELSLALRVHGYETMAPRNCRAQTDLMPTAGMLWAQRCAGTAARSSACATTASRPASAATSAGSRSRCGPPPRAGCSWSRSSVVLVHRRAHGLLAVSAPALRLRSVIRMVQVKELGWSTSCSRA